MRIVTAFLGILLLVGAASADKDLDFQPYEPVRDACNMPYVAFDWDFSVGDHGFMPTVCDPTGGAPVWEYGVSNQVPGYTNQLWGTVLNASYPVSAGEGLLSPEFTVTDGTYLLEVEHWIHTEANYDGCNVKVNGAVIQPMVA